MSNLGVIPASFRLFQGETWRRDRSRAPEPQPGLSLSLSPASVTRELTGGSGGAALAAPAGERTKEGLPAPPQPGSTCTGRKRNTQRASAPRCCRLLHWRIAVITSLNRPVRGGGGKMISNDTADGRGKSPY